MYLLMVVAALVAVTQLTVLGSWARSLRMTTLFQGITVGFLVCGSVSVMLQFGWTRLYALLTSTPVAEVQAFAAWAVDPLIEEIIKVAPLVVLAWWWPRTQRQLGYTDHFLYGAALGAGFELLEAALRFSRVGVLAQDVPGGYLATAGLWGMIFVPSVWTSLTTWQPEPAQFQPLIEASAQSTVQHLNWTAFAAVGIVWFTRHQGGLRWLGVIPLAFVWLDHANYNFVAGLGAESPAWWNDLISWLGARLPSLLVVILIATVAADRIIQSRGRSTFPDVLLPGEPPTGFGVAPWRTADRGLPWSLDATWRFVLARRAAITTATQGETAPTLRTEITADVAVLSKVNALPSGANDIWQQAGRQVIARVNPRALLNWRMYLWTAAILPGVIYLFVGGFPATKGIQEAMQSPWGLAVLTAGMIVCAGFTVVQLRPMWRAARSVTAPALHERRMRTQARIVTAVAALIASALTTAIALIRLDPGARLVEAHVLDAISNALLIVGIALLIVGAFALFPPSGPALALAGEAAVAAVAAQSATTVLTTGAILTATGAILQSQAGTHGNSGESQPDRHTDNSDGRTRTYGKSLSDIRGKAKTYARRQEARGFKTWIGEPRTGRYGPKAVDITVTVTNKVGKVVAIRHFIFKG